MSRRILYPQRIRIRRKGEPSLEKASDAQRILGLEAKEESRRVIKTLFQMRDGKEHGDTLQKFITDVLLRDEKKDK